MQQNSTNPDLSKEEIKALAKYVELLIEINRDLKKRGIDVHSDGEPQ